MTKQEQIEEMAVIGCVRNPQAHKAEECSKCDFKQGMCNAYRHAEALYDAGYRKIPENAVVLTKEEYIDLSRNYVREQIEQVRKGTAKEILGKLNALMGQYHYKSTAWRNCANFIKERYDVEVEE